MGLGLEVIRAVLDDGVADDAGGRGGVAVAVPLEPGDAAGRGGTELGVAAVGPGEPGEAEGGAKGLADGGDGLADGGVEGVADLSANLGASASAGGVVGVNLVVRSGRWRRGGLGWGDDQASLVSLSLALTFRR